jgi:hypothetical protein
MSNRTQKPSLLGKDFSALFSPIRINADIAKTNKPFAVYEFTNIFFPNMVPSIVTLLLDMERHSHRLITAIKPEKRERLAKDLEGVTVEIHYVIKDRGKELMALPINICPAEVLKNAALAKHGSRYTKKMQEEINQIFASFIKKEIQRRIKSMTESFLKTLLAKPRIPAMLKKLLGLGLIDGEGHLARGTTIEDLISGKYAGLFKKVVPEELINETLMLKETIKAYYDWGGEDYISSANEALAEKGILEIIIGEIGEKGISSSLRDRTK